MILRLNKLSTNNFVEFLNYNKKIVFQTEKYKICDVPKWDAISNKKEKYYFDDYLEEALSMGKIKVINNYNIEQSNQLIKKGIFPIGCGINPKSGGFFLVFPGTAGYFNTLELITLENKQNQRIQD